MRRSEKTKAPKGKQRAQSEHAPAVALAWKRFAREGAFQMNRHFLAQTKKSGKSEAGSLFHRHGFCQVPGLIHVGPHKHSRMVGDELHGDGIDKRRHEGVQPRHREMGM